jgi:hypothetical protein
MFTHGAPRGNRRQVKSGLPRPSEQQSHADSHVSAAPPLEMGGLWLSGEQHLSCLISRTSSRNTRSHVDTDIPERSMECEGPRI